MFRLPDGGTTENAVVYSKAWMDLAEIIGEVTGSSLYAFDPGLAFFDLGRPNAGIAQLPAWFAIRLAEALEGEI